MADLGLRPKPPLFPRHNNPEKVSSYITISVILAVVT